MAQPHVWRPPATCLYVWGTACIAYAHLLIAERDSRRAYDLLEQCLPRLLAHGLRLLATKALIVQACALWSQGHAAAALARQELALAHGEAGQLVRAFVDEGATAYSLLTLYRDQRSAGPTAGAQAAAARLAYLDTLLRAFPVAVTQGSITPTAIAGPSVLVDPLTLRELEVLRLIAAGLSNEAIAQKLVIAVGTVKAHTSSIYRRLDVPGRTSAVAAARDLHLI